MVVTIAMSDIVNLVLLIVGLWLVFLPYYISEAVEAVKKKKSKESSERTDKQGNVRKHNDF